MNVQDAEKQPATQKKAPPWLGRRVGRFKLLALLGQGAMGRVFRAEDVQLQRQVALKVLPLQFKFGDKMIGLEQFVREARSAASLDHPGVVQVYEVNETREVFYIAMELVEGGNLRDLVKAHGPLDVLRACQLGAEAAEALGHAHQMGIVHRDVKPSNLMLSRGGRCKLTDFGLARIDDPGDTFSLGTEAVGTPLYMPPEVARGTAAEPASDVYSLGATLCFLLCGRSPFQGRTAKEILDQHVNAPIPDLREWRPDLPPGLAETISRALAKRPKDRFESAEQFGSALRVHTIPLGGSGALPMLGGLGSGMMGSGIGSAGGTLTGTTTVSPRQLRNVLIGIGAAVAAMVGIGIWYVEFYNPPRTLPAITPSASVSTPASADNTPATPPVTAEPASEFSASDTARLLSIANDPKNPLAFKSVTVVGIPKKTHMTSSGNMRIEFAGVDEENGFQVFCPDTLLKDMQRQFGGINGAGIVGHQIAVQGVAAISKGHPQIRIESANQIWLVRSAESRANSSDQSVASSPK
jgi:hypothetical protein